MRKDSTMTSKFAMRNIKGYLVVTEEILSFRRQTTEDKNKEIIDLYLSQMLDAAMWQAHSLKLPERIKLARLCLQKYKKYVSTKTIGALLFKFLFINHKKRSTMASNIKNQLFSGVFYTALAKYSGIVISLVIAGILARLLSPDDFGIVAVATVIIAFSASSPIWEYLPLSYSTNH